MHGRRRGRNTRIGGAFFNEVVVKNTRRRIGCLRLHGDALLQRARIFVDKTQQDMLAAHTLAQQADPWMLLFHPGIHDRFESGHAIAAFGAIKAFEPVQFRSFP